MPNRFECPHCGRQFETPDNLAGQVVLCPHCGGQNVLPPKPDPLVIRTGDPSYRAATRSGGFGLLDFGFRRFVTPSIIRGFYLLHVIVAGLFFIGGVVIAAMFLLSAAASERPFTDKLTVVVGVLLGLVTLAWFLLGSIVATRIVCELALLVFRIEEHWSAIRQNTKRLVENTAK